MGAMGISGRSRSLSSWLAIAAAMSVLSLALVVTPSGASDNGDGITLYFSPPFVQGPPMSVDGTATRIETFDDKTVSATGCVGATTVGTVSGTCNVATAGPYGGATSTARTQQVGGSGTRYASTGASGSRQITFALDAPARYVGFWWSAGSNGNQVDFYEPGNPTTPIASFTLNGVVSLLGTQPSPFPGSATLGSNDGTRYPKGYFFGNPRGYPSTTPTSPISNPTFAGNEPFVFLNLFLTGSVTVDKVVFIGGGFEFDNVVTSTLEQEPADDLIFVQSVLGSSVDFRANGGTGTMAAQTSSAPTALRSNAFDRAGFEFAGWNTEMDGSGTPYANEGTYAFDESMTLFAQWTPLTYALIFDSEGGSPVSPATWQTGEPLALPAPPIRDGYVFAGWYTEPNGGDSVGEGFIPSAPGDLTLYARWTVGTYSVSFDTQGGTPVPDGSFQTGGSVELPPAPTRDGYVFLGWFATAEGGEPLTSPYLPTAAEDIVIFAQWAAIPTPVPPNPVPPAPEPPGPVVDPSQAASSGQPLPVTGASVRPMFIGSLTAILFGFAMLVSSGQVRPAWATRLAATRVDPGKRRRRSTRPAAAPLAFVDTVVESRVDVPRPVPSAPVARPVVPSTPPVEWPMAPVPVVIRSRVPVEAEPVVVPEAAVVEEAPAVPAMPGWMRAQAVVAAQLAEDWAAADRVSSAAQVAALRARLRQLEGVAGERAARWRARLSAEHDRLAAEAQA